jgi:hypothetical protein
MIRYNKSIYYSLLTNLCVIYVTSNHLLVDVLECKSHIRSICSNVVFVNIKYIRS